MPVEPSSDERRRGALIGDIWILAVVPRSASGVSGAVPGGESFRRLHRLR